MSVSYKALNRPQQIQEIEKSKCSTPVRVLKYTFKEFSVEPLKSVECLVKDYLMSVSIKGLKRPQQKNEIGVSKSSAPVRVLKLVCVHKIPHCKTSVD